MHNISRNTDYSNAMRKRRAALLASVVVVAAAAAPVARCADVDTSEWVCEYCPFAAGYQADYAVGISHVSDSAAKFGDASGYAEQGAYVNLDGAGSYTRDAYRMSWVIEDLGLTSRRASLEGGRPGNYEYNIAYRELPHHVFDTTSTIFTPGPGNSLTLPDGWVTAALTSSMSALQDSLRARDIESKRQTLALGGTYFPLSDVRLSAKYRHEERDGTDIVGGSFFTQASLLPRNFDYQTDDLELALRYTGARGHIGLAWHTGWFQDDGWALVWDNPFTAAAGASQGRLAQSPDSQYQQLALSGNYRLDAYDTVVAVSGARGQMQQDDQLLPFTINPDLAGNALPIQSLAGKVDTTSLGLTVTARPHARARLRFAYRYEDRDNRTAREQWQRVIADSFSSGDVQINRPYSFERTKLTLATRVKILDNLDAEAGYVRSQNDRDLQEVARQTENGGWGRLRWAAGTHLELSARGGTSKRDIDGYDTTLATSLGQNPLLRKYDLAYRYRRYGDVKAVATLPGSDVSLGVALSVANDDYTKSPLGLQYSDDLGFTVDFDWPVSKRASLYLSAGSDRIESAQTASEGFGAPDWRATHDDRFLTGSAALNVRAIAPHTDLRLDYTRSDGRSRIAIDSASAGRSELDDLETQLDALRLHLVYRKSEKLETTLGLRYEKFSTNDWALAGVEPATIGTVLTLGADPYDYDVFLVGLSFRYVFGDRVIKLPD